MELMNLPCGDYSRVQNSRLATHYQFSVAIYTFYTDTDYGTCTRVCKECWMQF